MDNFEYFFPKRLSVNPGAFVGAIEGALESLRVFDLQKRFPNKAGLRTYPDNKWPSPSILAKPMGEIVTSQRTFEIMRVEWKPETFAVEVDVENTNLIVGLVVHSWKWQRLVNTEPLLASLYAWCAHSDQGRVAYRMGANLQFDPSSTDLVNGRSVEIHRGGAHLRPQLDSHQGRELTKGRSDPLQELGEHFADED